MGTLQHIVIILACLLLQSQAAHPQAIQHPPIMEGKNTTLSCTGPIHSGDRTIYWDGFLPNGTVGNIATCHKGNQLCHFYEHWKYIVSVRFGLDTFYSKLSILSINHLESYRTYKCKVSGAQAEKSRIVESWDIMNIFYAADNASCDIIVSRYVELRINCSTTKIYPDILCEFSEISGEIESVVSGSLVSYEFDEVDFHGYKSASCSVVKFVPRPGRYTYRVKIYPEISAKGLKEAVKEIFTQSVIVPQRSVAIIQQTCDRNNQLMSFICIAYWLPGKPNFIWSVDGNFVNGTDSSSSIYEFSFNTYMSYVDLSKLSSQSGKLLKCEAQYKIGDSHEIIYINDTVFIEHIWSPQQSYFTLNDHVITENSLRVEERETTGVFKCKVKTSNQELSSLHVICQKGPQVVVQSIGKNMDLSFRLNLTKSNNGIYCHCFVRYVKQCYNENISLTLLVGHTSSSSQQQETDVTMIIIYSTGGFLLFVFLAVVFFAFVRSPTFNEGHSVCPKINIFSASNLTITPRIGQVHHDSLDDVPESMAPAVPTTTCVERCHRNGNRNSNIGPPYVNNSTSEPPPIPPREGRSSLTSSTSTLSNKKRRDARLRNKTERKRLPFHYGTPAREDCELRFVHSLENYHSNRPKNLCDEWSSLSNNDTILQRNHDDSFENNYLQLLPDIPSREPL